MATVEQARFPRQLGRWILVVLAWSQGWPWTGRPSPSDFAAGYALPFLQCHAGGCGCSRSTTIPRLHGHDGGGCVGSWRSRHHQGHSAAAQQEPPAGSSSAQARRGHAAEACAVGEVSERASTDIPPRKEDLPCGCFRIGARTGGCSEGQRCRYGTASGPHGQEQDESRGRQQVSRRKPSRAAHLRGQAGLGLPNSWASRHGAGPGLQRRGPAERPHGTGLCGSFAPVSAGEVHFRTPPGKPSLPSKPPDVVAQASQPPQMPYPAGQTSLAIADPYLRSPGQASADVHNAGFPVMEAVPKASLPMVTGRTLFGKSGGRIAVKPAKATSRMPSRELRQHMALPLWRRRWSRNVLRPLRPWWFRPRTLLGRRCIWSPTCSRTTMGRRSTARTAPTSWTEGQDIESAACCFTQIQLLCLTSFRTVLLARSPASGTSDPQPVAWGGQWLLFVSSAVRVPVGE